MGDVMCPLQARRGTIPCRGVVNAIPAMRTTRVAALVAVCVDFTTPRHCSPSPVNMPEDDPMCAEASLCMQKKDVRASVRVVHAQSIDICPRGSRASCSHHHGFMGSALDL